MLPVCQELAQSSSHAKGQHCSQFPDEQRPRPAASHQSFEVAEDTGTAHPLKNMRVWQESLHMPPSF